LQIALVGQPELDEKLDAPELRQLKQRIALRCSLEPLNWEDTQKYIEWRLLRAGAKDNSGIFSEDTLAAVYRYSRGIPRLINTICENSLVSAYAAGVQSVSVRLVKEVCEDLRLDIGSESPDREGPSFELSEELELAFRRVFEEEILVSAAAEPSSEKPVAVQPAEELAIDKVFHNWGKRPISH